MSPSTTALRLDLKKTEGLTVEFADGRTFFYPLALLRSKCPCASCREMRQQQATRPRSLTVLKGTYDGPLKVVNAQLVGNYALQIEWSDEHTSGIYSFDYLREIAPQDANAPAPMPNQGNPSKV